MESPAIQPISPFKKIFLSGWLAKALTVSGIFFALMVSFAYGSDLYYQKVFSQSRKSNPTQVLAPFMSPTPAIAQISGTSPLITSTDTSTPIPTQIANTTATATPRATATQAPGTTATPTHANQASNTPTSSPQSTNTNSPSPTQAQAAGCYVLVSGYLYNMQAGIGANAIDPNTGKSHAHTTNDYHCGTQGSPVDATAIYLEKHLAMGCAARLAPYIVTPPAPEDPSCE
jgi:hypothetical protein